MIGVASGVSNVVEIAVPDQFRSKGTSRLPASADGEEGAQDSEFVEQILTLYAADVGGETSEAGAVWADETQLRRFICEARQTFLRRQEAGDALASAIMSLTASEWGDAEIATLAVERGGGRGEADVAPLAPAAPDPQSLDKVLYELAVADVKDGHAARAAVVLAVLLHRGCDAAAMLAGLSVCGARLNNFDAALTIAVECMKLPVRHPRAYFVAGLCEFKRGNRKAARSLLALAARFARKDPEFRADMHAAQRLLLILHFG